jgi:glyoxylase-like metal-dependent hydrolase (beta-lactamase superfamily II)
MQLIKPGIYYEDSYLGVTLGAVALPQGVVLIDAPLRPEDARAWRSSALGLRSGPLRLLISLDGHLDRTLGARAIECTIAAHQKTAQMYRNRPMVFKGQGADSGSDWESYDEAIGTRWAAPDITFSHTMRLYWGGPEIVLEHHPGPAAGAIWVIIPSRQVAFIGDSVTPNQPPFLALADLTAWLESLDLLAREYREFTLVSGRGGMVTIEEVRAQARYLKNVNKALERLAQRNAPPEATESLSAGLLANLDFPEKYKEQYTLRLRTGLFQYYNYKYRQAGAPEQVDIDEGED